MILIQVPVLGYKIVHRKIPPVYNNQNIWYNGNFGYPYYNGFRNIPSYRNINPIKRIKSYFTGNPTGYTITPGYNINSSTYNQRNFFEDSPVNEYYYDNGGYYTQNREIRGGGSVTIIND